MGNQRARTRRPARPRNEALGCLAAPVVRTASTPRLAALWALGGFVRAAGPGAGPVEAAP